MRSGSFSAIDVASSYAWTELVSCPRGHPTGEQTSKLARRVAADLAAAGWRLERVLSDNGGEFRAQPFRDTLAQLGARQTLIRAGRPQTNGAVVTARICVAATSAPQCAQSTRSLRGNLSKRAGRGVKQRRPASAGLPLWRLPSN